MGLIKNYENETLDTEKNNSTQSNTAPAEQETQNNQTESNNNAFNDDGGMGALLEGFKNKTDKDAQGGAGNSSNSSSPSGSPSSPQPVNRGKITYANHELVAQLTVAALSVSMGLILQFIAQDWTEEAEKKYSLSGTRKKELEQPLSLMLEQSKSKYNPAIIFFITVLVAYVPMFIGAFRVRKQKVVSARMKKIFNKGSQSETVIHEDNTVMDTAIQSNKQPKPQVQPQSIGRSFTEAQRKRIEKIKKTRGRRSEEDIKFIQEMGLTGII